jgi:hypothetical protein
VCAVHQDIQSSRDDVGWWRVYYVRLLKLPRAELNDSILRKNVARAWTNETAVMCDRELSEDLPYNQ